MVSIDLSESISETLDILNHIDKTYVNKIPKTFLEFLERNKDTNYISKLDHSNKLNEMDLKEKTKNILAIIYMNYWCNAQEKEKFVNLLNENEIQKQKDLRDRYNPDNLFEKQEYKTEEKLVMEESQEQSAMIEYQETIFQKFINKIKSVFHIN